MEQDTERPEPVCAFVKVTKVILRLVSLEAHPPSNFGRITGHPYGQRSALWCFEEGPNPSNGVRSPLLDSRRLETTSSPRCIWGRAQTPQSHTN